MKSSEVKELLKERFGIGDVKYNLVKSKGTEIRIMSAEVMNIGDIYDGMKGFVAYTENMGPANDFIQLIGKDASKNIVLLNEDDARKFAAREKIRIKVRIKKGPVILKYKSHVLGLGTYDGFYVHPKIKEKRKRRIQNSIK